MKFEIDKSIGDNVPIGGFLSIAGNDGQWIIRDYTAGTITIAPWTWICRVINWNPCNDSDLVVGVFE